VSEEISANGHCEQPITESHTKVPKDTGLDTGPQSSSNGAVLHAESVGSHYDVLPTGGMADELSILPTGGVADEISTGSGCGELAAVIPLEELRTSGDTDGSIKV